MAERLAWTIDQLYHAQGEARFKLLRRFLQNHHLCIDVLKELESANLSLPSLPLTRGKPERKWTASPLTLDSKSSTWTPQQQTIDAWSKDTTTFWTSTSWTVNFSGQLTDVYESTRLLRDRKGQDVLRFRFLCLFFYDLVHLVFPNHGKRLPEYITQHLVDLISIDDSVNHLDQEISTDVKDWVSKGKRYHTLVEAFGEAVLIQLPVDTQTEALRRLPLVNDHRFREAVSGIDKSKLTDEAQTTGREIRDSALQPFRSLSVEDPRPYDTQRASTWRSEENVICHNKQSVLNGVAIPRPLSHRTDAASRKRRCLRPATPNIPCRESRDMHSQTQKDNMGAAGTASGLEATAQDSSSILASNKFGTPHTSKPMAQSEHVDHYRQSSTRAQSARASPSVVSDSALNFDSAIPVPSVVHPSGSWQSSSNPSQRSYASTGGQTTNGHSEIDLLLQTANSAPRGLEGMSSNLSLLNNNNIESTADMISTGLQSTMEFQNPYRAFDSDEYPMEFENSYRAFDSDEYPMEFENSYLACDDAQSFQNSNVQLFQNLPAPHDRYLHPPELHESQVDTLQEIQQAQRTDYSHVKDYS